MSRLKVHRHAVDILFTLALFCVLAASSIMVVVIGVQSYRDIVLRMTDNYNTRTSLSYIGTKVRQNDIYGAVYADTFGDGTALVLEQTVGDNTYQTRIYQSGGQMRELFTNKENQMSPAEGQPIMEIKSLQVEEVSDGLFRISVVDENDVSASLLIGSRCNDELLIGGIL